LRKTLAADREMVSLVYQRLQYLFAIDDLR
jgi:hypothetical protein